MLLRLLYSISEEGHGKPLVPVVCSPQNSVMKDSPQFAWKMKHGSQNGEHDQITLFIAVRYCIYLCNVYTCLTDFL